nr:hypothetical protein [Paracoccus saliphilus]
MAYRNPNPNYPAALDLPVIQSYPDILTRLDGATVSLRAEWAARRAELLDLIQHYNYGYAPANPGFTVTTVLDRDAFGGKARLRSFDLVFNTLTGSPKVQILLAEPKTGGPYPLVCGMNRGGNQSLLPDADIPLTTGGNPVESVRGSRMEEYAFEMAVDRGYAMASWHCAEFCNDRLDANTFFAGYSVYDAIEGTTPGRHDWHILSAWAWGISRALDHLLTLPEIDAKRVAVSGLSRRGKATALAGALDDRITVTIPIMSGYGGVGPYRPDLAVSPHDVYGRHVWHNQAFGDFADTTDMTVWDTNIRRMPFDGHSLIACCAPRRVLVLGATSDQYGNPRNEWEMLTLADGVYNFLGFKGLNGAAYPNENNVVGNRLAFHRRSGLHGTTNAEWVAVFDYMDESLVSVLREADYRNTLVVSGQPASFALTKQPMPKITFTSQFDPFSASWLPTVAGSYRITARVKRTDGSVTDAGPVIVQVNAQP